MRRGWAIAFVVTWFAVTIILNNAAGWSDNASVRMATLVALVVAGAVWYLTRALDVPPGAPRRWR